jgi:hypothetical protein
MELDGSGGGGDGGDGSGEKGHSSSSGSSDGSSSSRWNPATLPSTYFGLALLGILGDDLRRVDTAACAAWLRRLQRADGSFGEMLAVGDADTALGDGDSDGDSDGGADVRRGCRRRRCRRRQRYVVEGPQDVRYSYWAAGTRWILLRAQAREKRAAAAAAVAAAAVEAKIEDGSRLGRRGWEGGGGGGGGGEPDATDDEEKRRGEKTKDGEDVEEQVENDIDVDALVRYINSSEVRVGDLIF